MSTTPINSSIISLVQARQTLLERPDLALEAQEALQDLQIQDALISDEIVDQIAAQQLPMLTALPDDVVIVEDQDIDINAPEPKESADAPELCHITEPVHQPLPNVLSLHTALSALSNPNILTTQVFEIAVTLANTAHRNRKDFAHQTELYEEAVARLEREARRPAPADDPPYGYIPNDNIAPYFTIPDRGGRLYMAPFLRRCPGDPTHVIGTMGTPNNDEEHLCPIYAAPRHSDGRSLAALPPWFLDLIHNQSPHTKSLVDCAINMGDWGLGADIHRYTEKSKTLANLYREKDRITASIQAAYEDQEYVCHRLERAQAPSRLNHFCSLSNHDSGAPFRTDSNGNNGWSRPIPIPQYKTKHSQGRLHG
jgi:cell division protein FtsL